jgi:hypothetical protein
VDFWGIWAVFIFSGNDTHKNCRTYTAVAAVGEVHSEESHLKYLQCKWGAHLYRKLRELQNRCTYM